MAHEGGNNEEDEGGNSEGNNNDNDDEQMNADMHIPRHWPYAQPQWEQHQQ